MSEATGARLARAYFEKVLNAGDMATADEILDPGIRFHYPFGELSGADAVKRYIATVRAAFPDLRFTVLDLFGDGGRAAARWSLAGTQTGEFRGTAPTGRKVGFAGLTMFKLADAKIKEIWVMFDPAQFV